MTVDTSLSTKVCIQRSTYDQIDIEALLVPLGGIKKYVTSGDNVLLKTNLLNASEPEKHIVTNPLLVGAVAQAILKVGGTPFIGDSPMGHFTKRRLEKAYQKAGLKELSDNLGLELNYDTSSKIVKISDGKKLKKTPICNFVLNADRIIALPKLKTHLLMIMTLATKIMFGAVHGLTKARYHSTYIRRKAFADMLLDILSVASPDLYIMDGITGMQGNGPAGGDPAEIGVVLASENPVGMDLAVCQMLEIEPLGVPTLKQAKIRKMWPTEIQYPLISPQDVAYTDFQLPTTAGYLLTGKRQPSRSPMPTEKCVACGECVEACPVDAIRIDGIAKVNYSKCIKCYCCHEICAHDAINLEIVSSS